MKRHERLLVFDILRIVSVWLIVASHVGLITNHYLKIPNIYYPSWGGIGVTLLLIVSGAVLQYNYNNGISSVQAYRSFIVRRLSRIYPAYWISLLIALLVSAVGYVSLIDNTLVLQISGFMAFTNQWGGEINAVGWFIGLIVVLYLLFPILSKFCRYNPYLFIATMLIISIAFRYYFITNHIGLRPADWFPCCRFFEFGLGIFLVQMNFYPKWTYDNKPIYTFAEMSFYVFLVHFPIVYLWKINPVVYLVCTCALASLLMWMDNIVQERLIKWPGSAHNLNLQ